MPVSRRRPAKTTKKSTTPAKKPAKKTAKKTAKKATRQAKTPTPPRQRIRCPRCAWEPDGRKLWQCDACSAVFDTFETRAHCPKCEKSWRWTQCISCGAESDHAAWYVDEERG